MRWIRGLRSRVKWFCKAIPWRLHMRWLGMIGYPDALIKACYDEFDYAAGIELLGVVRFQLAHPRGFRWVHLDLYWGDGPAVDPPIRDFCFARGVGVRLRDISWVADAPIDS